MAHGAYTPADLRASREAAGLSQQTLADVLGVGVGTVSRWERGARKIPPYLVFAMIGIMRAAEPLRRKSRRAGEMARGAKEEK